VNEAVEITEKHNVFEKTLSSLANHVLVADTYGQSVILEINGGEMQVIPNENTWHVITNTLVYDNETVVQQIPYDL